MIKTFEDASPTQTNKIPKNLKSPTKKFKSV